MSLFDKINKATNTVNQAGRLVQQGSTFINDIVGTRAKPTEDYPEQEEFDDPNEMNSFPDPPINHSPTRRLRSESDLRRMAETKGNMVFVLMKSVSVAVKSIISRILITKGSDEEVTELFSRLSDMADDAGVNVYQFVPTEVQMEELGITDKNLLLNEGKKAEKKRNLLRALEEENPEIDDVFKEAVIESLYNKYRDEDERGELKVEGLMDVIMSYGMVTVVGAFSNSGYNIIDMLLDLVLKKKPITAPVKPKTVISNPPTTVQNGSGSTLEELVSNRGKEFGQNVPDDEHGTNGFEPEPTIDSL